MPTSYEMSHAEATKAHNARCKAFARRSQYNKYLKHLNYFEGLPKDHKWTDLEKANYKIVKAEVKRLTAEMLEEPA